VGVSATVPDGDTIARLVEFSAGRLHLDDLPGGLDFDSVRLGADAISGATIVSVGGAPTPTSTAAALKLLAQLAGTDHRSVAVLSELSTGQADWRDEHDRIGRLAVRLNVGQLIVVGQGARHIHNAAGLEGSWDGESQLVETADTAYDLLREDLRTGDVVLVGSSGLMPLDTITARLTGGVAW
jgi:UDP-N-acetylmuramoyl-tripeptide--D-alanyl-D-alanine ligase